MKNKSLLFIVLFLGFATVRGYADFCTCSAGQYSLLDNIEIRNKQSGGYQTVEDWEDGSNNGLPASSRNYTECNDGVTEDRVYYVYIGDNGYTYLHTTIKLYSCQDNICNEGMSPDINGVCSCQDGLIPDGDICVLPPECPEYYEDVNGTCEPTNPDDIDDDGIPNAEDPDIDGDSIPNWEDPDIDGDGTPNNEDDAPGGGGGDDNAECGSGAVYSNQHEECVCLNGTNYENGCISSSCPSSYNNLPLKSQNVTQTQCLSNYPPHMGYAVEYMNDGTLSCCFADKVSEPEPCGVNQYRDNDGFCQDIPTSDPECDDDEYLENGQCLPIPCEDGQIRNEHGVCAEPNSGNTDCIAGYIYDEVKGKCVIYLSGGGSDKNSSFGNPDLGDFNSGDGDVITDKILLDFTSEEIEPINDEYSEGMHNQFTTFLDAVTPDLTTIFDVSVPTVGSCGCKNPTINYKGHSQTVDICSPLDDIFGYMRPVLWFGLLLSILFGFFRGNN